MGRIPGGFRCGPGFFEMPHPTDDEDNPLFDKTIRIEYDHTPATKGARDSLGGVRGAGPPLEPDDPEEIEITAAYLEDGKTSIELTEEVAKAADTFFWNHYSDIMPEPDYDRD